MSAQAAFIFSFKVKIMAIVRKKTARRGLYENEYVNMMFWIGIYITMQTHIKITDIHLQRCVQEKLYKHDV